MRSTAIDRRGLLAGAAALLAAPRTGARIPDELYLAARADTTGGFALAAFDGAGNVRLDRALPARGHAVAYRPGAPEIVVVGRRPGAFALVVDLGNGAVLHELEPTPGRSYAGHAVFSPDGRHLLLTEDDADAEAGFVALRDAGDGYRPAADFTSGGVGPHELLWLDSGPVIAVANGGILTGPDTGRAPLNLASMEPSLVLLDTVGGRLLRRTTLPTESHRLSIRHLAALTGKRLAFAMQDQGPPEDGLPLVGILDPDGAVRFLPIPADIVPRLQGYLGSIAADASGRWLAASAPRGNIVLVWDPAGRFAGTVEVADGCGLCRTAMAGEFLLSSGTGGLLRVICGSEIRALPISVAVSGPWDNHLTFRAA